MCHVIIIFSGGPLHVRVTRQKNVMCIERMQRENFLCLNCIRSDMDHKNIQTVKHFIENNFNISRQCFFILKLNLLSFKTKVHSVDIFKMCLPQCENFLQCSLQHFFHLSTARPSSYLGSLFKERQGFFSFILFI